MEENKYIKLLGLFLTAFVLFFSISFLFNAKEEFSENENRILAKFPTLSWDNIKNGKYMEGIKDFLTDHFPMRNTFMSVKKDTELALGKQDINDVFFGKDEYLLTKYEKPVNTDRLIEVLNSFFKNNNYVNMNLMLVPTSITINKEKLPNFAPTYDEIKTIDYIYKNITFDTINIANTLLENKDKYQLYYRLDHHWTTYGAYYAYLEYCRMNGLIPIDINSFDIKEISNSFNGTLYSKTNEYSYTPDKIHLFYPKNDNFEINYVLTNRITNTFYEMNYLNKKDKYSLFLDNNHPLIKIKNKNISDNKKVLVLKDSYANSFIPLMANSFSSIDVIDLRYYKASITDYVKENGITDVLILYNINTIDNDLGIYSLR